MATGLIDIDGYINLNVFVSNCQYVQGGRYSSECVQPSVKYGPGCEITNAEKYCIPLQHHLIRH